MLFLYRPPQTWMPYALPRSRTDQADYNRNLQREFASTKRVPPPVPTGAARLSSGDRMAELTELRDSGVLTDDEYVAATSRLSRNG